MNEQESRDVLHLARAYRAAQTAESDYLAFVEREELLAGLR